MLNCIYCKHEKFKPNKGSEEHAILSSIGGRKISRNICCVHCNNRLGSTVDEKLSDKLSVFSTLVGIRTGRNKQAPVQKRLAKLNGEFYNLHPSGVMKKGTVHNKIIPYTEGITNVSIRADTSELAMQVLVGQLKSKGKTLDDLNNGTVTDIKEYGASIEFNLSFDENCLRAIAKMALTFVATQISPERLRKGIFNTVINYINGNDEYSGDIVYCDTNSKFPEEHKISIINHRIFLYASKNEKTCIALIELFGAITFSILLSREWDGEDINSCYVIDPVTTDKLDLKDIMLPKLSPYIEHRGCDMNKAKEQLNLLFNYICEQDKTRAFKQILDEHMNELDLSNLTDLELSEVAKNLSTKIVDLYFQRSSKIVRDINK